VKKQATMRDVAKLAGVTQPTVSYVINNTAHISEEVRERVTRAIDELNYTPNYFARGLKTSKSKLVGVVIPDILNEYYAGVVNKLEHMFRLQGFSIVVHSTNYMVDVEKTMLKSLIDYNVEAIVVAYQLIGGASYEILREYRRPVVILEGGEAGAEFHRINTDNFYGGYTAAMHLIGQGRRRIAYIGQSGDIEALRERQRGFMTAVQEQGLEEFSQVLSTSSLINKWEEGVNMGRHLRAYDLDGVVVSSDAVAIGILKSYLRAGVKIPGDVAIIGYDDIPLAEIIMPGLTTMAQPMEDMCSVAVDKVVQGLKGDTAVATHTILKPQLVQRETS